MNYTFIKKENFENLKLKAYLYEHKKTKAKIYYVDTDDLNKTFAIGFKTAPKDSMGMAHIMEHSVLNGSKKYRSKDPFMDMASSSLQTFLNAMTYPDKTVFPVSSENDKDFFNLTDVYLDAVFNPLVLEKKEILDQEGWHYDLDEDGKICSISGVVYNEMKGALTDPDTIIYNDINSYLYKNSPYEHESGGNPEHIIDLTYDKFIEFYKPHYHPSNASIYFYGKLDIDFYLEHLDEEYLSKYEYKDINEKIEVVENHYDKAIYTGYPVSENSNKKDYLSYAMLTNSSLDMKESLTQSILVNMLFNMDSSKIRNDIVKEFNPDYFYARVGYGNRSSIMIQAQNVDSSKKDAFVKIIDQGLKEASTNLSIESLKSSFSIFDFAQRESLNSVNKGLTYFLMASLDQDLFDVFKLTTYLDELRELIGTGYYEDFIRKYFIDNKSKLVHIARPDKDFNSKKSEALAKRIAIINEKITEDELSAIKNDLDKLSIYQNKKNTQEEKDTIPKLNIEDVYTKIEDIPRKVIKDKFEYIYHDLETSGMIYTSMYFDLGHINLNNLAYVQIISELIASVDTPTMTYQEADDIIWQYLGGLNSNVSLIKINNEYIKRSFKLSFKTINSKATKAVDLVYDFINNSLFDNKDRILELLKMKKASFESSMYDSAHMISLNRANSHIDKFSYIKENISGIDYYLLVSNLIEEIECDFDSFKEKIEAIYKQILSKDLAINITSSQDDFYLIKDLIDNKFSKLSQREKDVDIHFEKTPKKEAIATNATVNYVAKSYDLKEFDQTYNGKLTLASSILSNPHLYELIRAKGGAYGAGLVVDRNALIGAFSYRDPNIKKTLDNYDTIGDILKNLEIDQRDFQNQQISSMGKFLKPKTSAQKGDSDFVSYLKDEEIDDSKILDDIKNASIEDIKSFADIFEKSMKFDNICVFANKDQIKNERDFFDEVIDLNE